jgi:hypothetical protein
MKRILLTIIIALLGHKAFSIDEKILLVIYVQNCNDTIHFDRVMKDPELCDCFVFDFVETNDPNFAGSTLAYYEDLLLGHIYGNFNKEFLLRISPKLESTAEDFRRCTKRTSMND